MKHKPIRPRLWTKDFSCITVATVLSAIGGEAMNLPISLLVFDQTQSTLLSALILVCGMLPDMILPILVAPLIDKGGKKKWIVGLDVLLATVYAAMGIWITGHAFSYGLYVGFTLVVGTISVFYRLAFDAWYPSLIPVGAEQRGYSVSATLYPLVTILMAPVATFLYSHVPMGTLFLVVSGLTVLSCLVEGCIREVRKAAEEAYTFRQYRSDIREGFAFLKREKGIRNIYTYMSITQGASSGVEVLTQAYYQTQPWLTVTMLGFLKSAEMLGRVLSGLLQYIREVPVRKRYAFTKFVYTFYDTMDAALLWMPFPLMLVNRFLCGGLGCASATIRETAVQSYLPEDMRARINAFFNVISSVGGVGFYLLAGLLGQVLPYRLAATLLGLTTLVSMFLLIALPAKSNRPVYEAVRKADQPD
ncbi:MAG: MFS transporter [Oscillospiraceae bacterium]